MSKEDSQQIFLAALRFHLHSMRPCAPVAPLSKDTLREVISLSELHQVTPMIVDALGSMVQMAPDAVDLFADWKRQAMRAVFLQTRRTQAFIDLCQALNRAQIPAVVFKGLLLRILYPKMDFRISSDEDLYIPASYGQAAHTVLCQSGMRTDCAEDSLSTREVVTYVCPATGLRVEVHHRLFSALSPSEQAMNSVFLGLENRRISVECNGAPLYGMPHTEHMLYLIFHALKHFVHSGFGIRQVCDINLYAGVHGRDIDWKRVFETLCHHRAQVFAAGIWQIGTQFLGFPDRNYLPIEPPDPIPLLQDILNGGVYGSSTEDRQHSSLITLNALAGTAASGSARIRSAVFPPLAQMAGKYPYLQRMPWLLPAAWGQRIAGYLRKGSRVSPAASISIGNQRVALLRKYGLL